MTIHLIIRGKIDKNSIGSPIKSLNFERYTGKMIYACYNTVIKMTGLKYLFGKI